MQQKCHVHDFMIWNDLNMACSGKWIEIVQIEGEV